MRFYWISVSVIELFKEFVDVRLFLLLPPEVVVSELGHLHVFLLCGLLFFLHYLLLNVSYLLFG